MQISKIKESIEKILDNNKAQNIKSINLKNKSYIADYMVIASGTSSSTYSHCQKFLWKN